MPIPSPHTGENQKDFIGRCMGDDIMNREYPDNKQRSAVCYSKWRKKELSKLLSNGKDIQESKKQ